MTKKAIGLVQFNELTQEEQFDILHRDGVHVGKRKVGRQTVILFQLYGFYVEVYYKHYRKEIDHTITSSSADILQPYLEQIRVKGLKGDNGKH
ncbi:MAG: hypothetical protein ACJ75B_15370 [Flavisolibacter sp.]